MDAIRDSIENRADDVAEPRGTENNTRSIPILPLCERTLGSWSNAEASSNVKSQYGSIEAAVRGIFCDGMYLSRAARV